MSKLVCRVELDKEKGIILTVENKDGKVIQTVVMNGESITTTSKGEQETSTITQKPDSIFIKCKDFTLETETITCTSTKDTLHKSDQKITVQSTGNMTFTATSDAELSAANTTLSAKADMKVQGSNLELSGSAAAKMKGGATTDVEAGGITSIKGALIKVG